MTLPKHETPVFELVTFQDTAGNVPLQLDSFHDTIWATQAEIGALFDKDIRTIGEHIKTIFKEGELDEASVIRKFRRTAKDGKHYSTLHYNLDVILSVGYRVSSKRATKFRKWASGILKSYLVSGYALNEARLSNDPNALHKVAAEVRRLRSGEKQIYESVRECFKISSSDYSSKSIYTKRFYAKLQDKFLYAITGETAAEIVLHRANRNVDLMGLTSTKSGTPTLADARIGKNYLVTDELYLLHILCEQFLLFAESRAIQGKEITMSELSEKFDDLLLLQGHSVFAEYKSYLRDRAEQHARLELEAYKQRARLERQARKRKKPRARD